jgi:phytoene dehydrogenase-like protein
VGLAHAFERAGGKFYAKTEAKEIKGGEAAKVTATNGQTITADAVVVAINTPVNDWVTRSTPNRQPTALM